MFPAVRRSFKTFLVTVIAVMFVAFAVDNRQFVSVSLFPLPYTIGLPEFLLAVICFALGAIVGGISIGFKLSHARSEAKAEHKRAAALQNEIDAMRAQPGKLPAVADTKP